MLKNWRSWLLVVLLVGPFAVYIGLGFLWLRERGWHWYAAGIWIAAGIVFAILAERWTKARRPVLPPLDWDAPQTFSPFDRQAWALVEEEAEGSEQASLESLTEFDVYIDTGRRLAKRLADHYHPLSTDPIDHVPVVELLTALELAADDLNRLCHQVPGGDLITPAHWKKAVQAAEYFQKANDWYSYLLPLISPVTGLVRLGTQQWMVKPAWRNMQQNVLRWFFRAYVNRLGTHLIELYSGRLSIGTERYRKLTRRLTKDEKAEVAEEPAPLTIAVAGARDAGKSSLIAALNRARTGDLRLVRAHLESAGLDDSAVERLKTANLVEVPGYTASPEGESARDRAARRDAVAEAVEADLLLLVVDARRASNAADVAFAQAWDRWYVEHPGLEAPPALAIIAGIDRPELGGDWKPPYDWSLGQGPREAAVRERLATLRAALPPGFVQVTAVGLAPEYPFGAVEQVLPALAALLHRAERVALIRHIHRISTRSKARRLIGQVGQHGRWLWSNLRSGHRARGPTANGS